ncbi:MAG: hypothetical protein K0Q49_2193 [Haloplasmataceae bacterium]|nr:hypothetical protein [Haloplasmataceae bacterium]
MQRILAYIFVFTAVLYALVNVFIYKSGYDFAKEHNATRYIVDYHYIDVTDAGPQAGFKARYHPSFFRFYGETESGKEFDLVLTNFLMDEYEEMNRKNDSYFEGFKLFVTVVLTISVIGVFNAIFKRVQVLGYILGSIFTISIYFNFGMLNYKSIIVVVGLLMSAYLVFKANFIDYNESRWFFKRKNTNNF